MGKPTPIEVPEDSFWRVRGDPPDQGPQVFVGRICVTVGEHVPVDAVILDLIGEKVELEMPSPVAGIVRHIEVGEGDQVVPGAILMTIDAD